MSKAMTREELIDLQEQLIKKHISKWRSPFTGSIKLSSGLYKSLKDMMDEYGIYILEKLKEDN